MILKKFNEFMIKESYLSSQKDLFIDKDKLIEEMKKLSKDSNKWGHGEDHLSYDLRGLFFNMWQDKDNPNVTDRNSMIGYALANYGIIPAFVLGVSGYIGQVNNGGHSQYFGNGYASINANRQGEGEDMELHNMLLELWEESGFNNFSKSGKLSYEIAKQFEIEEEDEECEWCGGSGDEEEEGEYEDDEGEAYTEMETTSCGNCGGTGYDSSSTSFQVSSSKNLDDKLYKVNKRFHSDMERFLAKHLLD
jgi:hypothetical protein